MVNAFSPKSVITKPEELFGREELLNQLISLANNRYSVSVTGLRRFGKTSLLRCVETALRKDEASRAYPIYFDFKDVGSIIKGTDNVYRYMIACFVSTLYKDKHFTEESIFKKKRIKASGDWEDIFESLEDVNSVRIQGLFEELITFFSEYLNKTVLFLIDEYEWLFRFSFDDPVGFMKLRNFSSKSLGNGINPFSFWIAGAIPWEYLCTLTGSGELNVIDAPPMHVGPIEINAFKSMWTNEINKIEHCENIVKSNGDFSYLSSGGVPFYGKLIGSHLVTIKNKPTYNLLKSYFQEIFSSLQNEEKTILIELAKSPRNFTSNKFVHGLLDKGVIKKEGPNYEIRIGFFKDFLNASISLFKDSNLGELPETYVLTNKITALITNINKTSQNKKGYYIFEPVVDEAALIKDLQTPCFSLELFSDFSSSLYKIVFERTKDTKNGIDSNKARLPNSFKRNNQFIEIVDIMRHSLGGVHIMDKFSPRPGQMSKPAMLNILVGNKNEPNTPDEFYSLQLSTLKLFESELTSLNSIVRSTI